MGVPGRHPSPKCTVLLSHCILHSCLSSFRIWLGLERNFFLLPRKEGCKMSNLLFTQENVKWMMKMRWGCGGFVSLCDCCTCVWTLSVCYSCVLRHFMCLMCLETFCRLVHALNSICSSLNLTTGWVDSHLESSLQGPSRCSTDAGRGVWWECAAQKEGEANNALFLPLFSSTSTCICRRTGFELLWSDWT